MPVINAHCPVDQAKLEALYQARVDWYEAHKIAVEKSSGKRLAELEKLGASKGMEYRRFIADRVAQVKAARKERARAIADAASTKFKSFDFNSLKEAIEA